jgi:hypothetical protein
MLKIIKIKPFDDNLGDRDLGLDRFLSSKRVLIDDSGWGDLIMGVVIGALKLPDRRYMERRIPVSSFQSPKFENKIYLDDAVRIAREIVEVMRIDSETQIEICSGYVLSTMRRYLRDRGFPVIETEIKGELQEKVERGFLDWCIEVGVPRERLEGKRSFWVFLEWVSERQIRENLVKNGWKSWQEKWQKKAHEMYRKRSSQAEESEVFP